MFENIFFFFFVRLICSDVMARGLDIWQVKNVIHYEVPSYVQTYVHRSGRTARAGAIGRSYTLLQKKEIGFFQKGILDKVEGGDKLMKLGISPTLLEPFLQHYQSALLKLKELIDLEKQQQSNQNNKEALKKVVETKANEVEQAAKKPKRKSK